MARKAKDEQLEFVDFAPSSPIGKAARKVLAIRDEIVEVNEDLEKKETEAKKNLIELMQKDGKEAISVDGKWFRLVHKQASDTIRILKEKKTKRLRDEDEEEEEE